MKIKLGTLLILLIISTVTKLSFALKDLYPQFSWKYLDYEFPNETARESAITNKEFIIGNPFLVDIDVYHGASGTKHFVTMPRLIPGMPVTLGVVTDVIGEGGPIIAPFPDYDWQQYDNCNGFTSVFRVFIDECERLWVVDNGVINEKQVCPPQLVVFDLKSECKTPIFTYKFEPSMSREKSMFITPIVDVRNNNCADTMVYIADVTGTAVIVFDYKNRRSWRAESPLLDPVEEYANFTIVGETFHLMDGVFGMSVSPKNYFNRHLFLHPLASLYETKIPLRVLDNPSNWQDPKSSQHRFVKIGTREFTQATVEGMDKHGNLFFGTIYPLGIGCWNSLFPYNRHHLKFVTVNNVTLQFIGGLKVVNNHRTGGQELWAQSCRFQKIILGRRNITEINYRVQAIPINELLGGHSMCNGLPWKDYEHVNCE